MELTVCCRRHHSKTCTNKRGWLSGIWCYESVQLGWGDVCRGKLLWEVTSEPTSVGWIQLNLVGRERKSIPCKGSIMGKVLCGREYNKEGLCDQSIESQGWEVQDETRKGQDLTGCSTDFFYYSQSFDIFMRMMTSSNVNFAKTSLTAVWEMDWRGTWVYGHSPIRRLLEKARQEVITKLGQWWEWRSWEEDGFGRYQRDKAIVMWVLDWICGSGACEWLLGFWLVESLDTVLPFDRIGGNGWGSGLETCKDCIS